MRSSTGELQQWEPRVRDAGHPAREAPSWTLHHLPSRAGAYRSRDSTLLNSLWQCYDESLNWQWEDFLNPSLLCFSIVSIVHGCQWNPAVVQPLWAQPSLQSPGLSWRTEAHTHIPRHLGSPARCTLRVANTGRTVSREMLNLHNPAFCAGEWLFVLPWNSTFNIADIARAAEELLRFFWVAVHIPRSQPRDMCLLSMYTNFFNHASAGSTKQLWNHHCRRNTRQSTLCDPLVLGERQLPPCPRNQPWPRCALLLQAKSLFNEFWHSWYFLQADILKDTPSSRAQRISTIEF